MSRQKRPFEEGDFCPMCRKHKITIRRDKVIECTASQGCNFEKPLSIVQPTSDYEQLKWRMDLIISNQRRIF